MKLVLSVISCAQIFLNDLLLIDTNIPLFLSYASGRRRVSTNSPLYVANSSTGTPNSVMVFQTQMDVLNALVALVHKPRVAPYAQEALLVALHMCDDRVERFLCVHTKLIPLVIMDLCRRFQAALDAANEAFSSSSSSSVSTYYCGSSAVSASSIVSVSNSNASGSTNNTKANNILSPAASRLLQQQQQALPSSSTSNPRGGGISTPGAAGSGGGGTAATPNNNTTTVSAPPAFSSPSLSTAFAFAKGAFYNASISSIQSGNTPAAAAAAAAASGALVEATQSGAVTSPQITANTQNTATSNATATASSAASATVEVKNTPLEVGADVLVFDWKFVVVLT